jgi:hypothetical protein
MRRRIFAALLCSSFLCTPAEAAPAVAFLGGALNALGAGTFLASGAVGAWTAGFSVGSWLGGSLIGRAVLSYALSAGINALTRRRVATPPPADVQANYAQALTAMERVYGRVRKGGPYGFTGFSSAAVVSPRGSSTLGKRHYAILLASHRIKGVVAHWLDKSLVTVINGWVETAPFKKNSEYYASIRFYNGAAGQGVDPILSSTFPELALVYNFKGLSYAALTASRCPDDLFSELYPNSREWTYAPVIDGCDTVYDPRTGLTGWTQNAALIIADLAIYYGKTVDWPEVAAQANICDQTITNGEGGTQARWTINRSFSLATMWEDHRAALEIACDAWFYERTDGSIGFKVGAYTEPTVTFTDRDLLSLSVGEGQSGLDQNDEFAVTYTEPADDYAEATSGVYVVSDGLVRRTEEAYAVDSNNQAWRVAKALARRELGKYQVSGMVKLIGYEAINQRFVRVTSAEMGVNMVVEITKFTREDNAISFSFEGSSVTAADFEADPDDEPARPLRAEITSDDTVVAPLDLAGTAQSGGVASILWEWAPSTSDLHQQLFWRQVGAAEWQIVTCSTGQVSTLVTGLIDGATYEAQLRNRTAAMRVSALSPATPVAVKAVANSVSPASVTSLAVALVSALARVSWIAPNDANYMAVRIFRQLYTTTPSLPSSTLIRTEYGSVSNSDSYDDNPTTGKWAYWVAPINASGVQGPVSGPVTITIV